MLNLSEFIIILFYFYFYFLKIATQYVYEDLNGCFIAFIKNSPSGSSDFEGYSSIVNVKAIKSD